MKIANWYGGKDFRIEDVPKPEIKDDEILIAMKAASICGSELHAYEGISKRREEIHGVPLVMGHEFSGEVAEVGKNVKNVAVGDRVGVNPIVTCGKCEQCMTGQTNICKNFRLLGLHVNGAFGEYVPMVAENCYKIPDSMTFEEASLLEPCSVGIHAINITPHKLGDDVVVLGVGTIGLMALQAAKCAGAGRIFATDTVDYRLDMAKKIGADEVINVKNEDPVEKIMELTGNEGVDAVIEAVGSEKTVQQGLELVKKGKTVTVIGMMENKMELGMLGVSVKETKIQGDYGYTKRDFASSLKLIASGRMNVKQIITHTLPLDDVATGFGLLAEKRENAVKVILKP